jgi:hypothetical protein
MKKFYVYVFLDQRISGNWNYKNIEFNFKPFYVGIGTRYRMTSHFTPYSLNKKSIKNNIIKSIYDNTGEYPLFYKIFTSLNKNDAISIEIDMIKHFGKIKDGSGILSNLTDGGDGISGFKHSDDYKNSLKKKLFQYNLNGEFIKEWESVKSIVDYYDLGGGNGLRYSIKSGTQCKGFLWSDIKLDNLNIYKGHKISQNIYYIYKDDVLIKTFNNKDEIINYFGDNVSFGNISSCCNGKLKTYLSYVWRKELKK